MGVKILVVEDDEHIGKAVRAFLRDAGYLVELCADGNRAHERIHEDQYRLIILDIMLPGMDGQELLRELRKLTDAPVLMMTALSGDVHEVNAFDNLADDYITKPFSMLVLLKRVEALLRRAGALRNELRIGRLVLYPALYKACWGEQELPLTLREFEILLLLARNEHAVISHDKILTNIWGYDYYGNEGTLHTHIKNLRGKLPVNIIRTVRGVGYLLEGPPEREGESR
ncbi:MAG: response regulator transcription factor [Treponema sp.]|jgi:two-component system response regulator VanR|nr:response regulator transcription factor [Treponema sp.]